MRYFAGATDAVAWLKQELGSHLRVATPLGLGKPNSLLNALYESELNVTLFTALSLNPPVQSGLAGRFLNPFAERHWGRDYPALKYAKKLRPNFKLHEFYFRAGAYLHNPQVQRDYVSVNYTHVAEAVMGMDVQCIVQLVAKRGDKYSLSCNPDLTLDLVQMYREAGKRLIVIGAVHPDLPFMGGDAEVSADFFEGLLEEPHHQLFALPRTPIDAVDHAIGLHTSTLIVDDGTIQVGIGSLCDAVVAALVMRQHDNAKYRELTGKALEPFEIGLYGLSEMVTDGFMHLRKAGILKREVGQGTYLHGAFFLGSKDFYAWLRESDAGIRMTRVSKVNDLYDPNEVLLRKQRKNARFLNTCMQATLLGGAASETLPDGRVVSGVGGQYNFVAMGHELQGARSILMLRSRRGNQSNIVWSHGQLTIPRHLRDIVVTEYGIADLRGRDDESCIKAMLAITDAEFQEELARTAQKHGKLGEWQPRPQNTRASLKEHEPFPFGSDFTPVEERLALALGYLQGLSKPALVGAIVRGLMQSGYEEELKRIGGSTLEQAAVLTALKRAARG